MEYMVAFFFTTVTGDKNPVTINSAVWSIFRTMDSEVIVDSGPSARLSLTALKIAIADSSISGMPDGMCTRYLESVPSGLIDPSTPSGYIENSCAFALRLQAWAHIRGNWGFIWYGEKLYAIAVERCICPPAVA